MRAAQPAVQQPAQLVRPALAVDRGRRPEPIERRQLRPGPHLRGRGPQAAHELAGSRRADLADGEAGPSRIRDSETSGADTSQPRPAADRVQVDLPAGLGEVEQRHRRHRVLVHGVDGVALDHRAGAGVVVPPPLPGRPLQLADVGRRTARLRRARRGRRRRRAAGPAPGSGRPGRRSSRRAGGSGRPGPAPSRGRTADGSRPASRAAGTGPGPAGVPRRRPTGRRPVPRQPRPASTT